jgi:predicted metal-dependent enzyme (double-stranded beta helix superfamily)
MLTGNPVFDAFVRDMHGVMDEAGEAEAVILEKGRALVAALVADDSWLPAEYTQPHPEHFKQYVLHRDGERGFTVMSVVWNRGQSAMAHDHKTWGIIGQLQGAEREREYEDPVPGQPLKLRSETVMRPGDTCVLSPGTGDIHDVANAFNGVSVSIHVYGADLPSLADRRHRYEVETGKAIPFVTTYY